MNTIQLLKVVRKLDLPINKFYILGDAALVIYGVKKETDEINLCISVRLFNTLREKGRINFSVKKDKGFYNLDNEPNIKVMTKYKNEFNCIRAGDLYLEDIKQIYECKKKNKRKNKVDIEGIERFLKLYPNYDSLL